MEVIDLNGKTIKVTDLKAAIAQAEMFSTYSDKTSPKELNQLCQAYWIDMRNKLRKLGLIEIIKIHDQLEDANPDFKDYPSFVKVMQMVFKDHDKSTKGYSKDGKTHPLYGAHSCVKTDQNLRKLDTLEIGETWERFGQPNITRIF